MKSSLLTLLCLIAINGPAQTYFGNYSGKTVDRSVVTLRADSSAVRFVPYAPGILRVDFLPSPRTTIDSSSLDKSSTT